MASFHQGKNLETKWNEGQSASVLHLHKTNFFISQYLSITRSYVKLLNWELIFKEWQGDNNLQMKSFFLSHIQREFFSQIQIVLWSNIFFLKSQGNQFLLSGCILCYKEIKKITYKLTSLQVCLRDALSFQALFPYKFNEPKIVLPHSVPVLRWTVVILPSFAMCSYFWAHSSWWHPHFLTRKAPKMGHVFAPVDTS